MSEPPTLLIVWHSQTGACAQAAEAVAAGARSGAEHSIRIELRHADAVDASCVRSASLVVVVAAETLAALSGRVKDFFDRCYYTLLDHTRGLPYASVICAGSDGENAQRQLDRIALGLRWKRVAEPLRLMLRAQTAEAILAQKRLSEPQRQQCHDMGAALAEGLRLGIF